MTPAVTRFDNVTGIGDIADESHPGARSVEEDVATNPGTYCQ